MTRYDLISHERIADYIKNHNLENVSDVLADIIHYCKIENLFFQVELNRADRYVQSDLEEMNLVSDYE